MSFPEGKQVERKQMEQRPIEAAPPLDPPAPDIARAYLDEAEAVAQRREDLIDRHAIALVSLVESIVLAGFLTMMMFGFGTPTASSSFIVLVAMALLWMQLTAELRESHGVQPRLQIQHGRTRIVFIAVVGCAVAIGVALQLGGVGIPLALRFAPGVLAIA